MLAYTYIEKGKFALVEKPKPALIETTDAIVRVTMSSICSSDLHIKHGSVPRAVPGITVGHEMVGIVEEVGAEVTNVKPGDRVTINVETFCGECFFCKNGYVNNCTDPNGGWALGCRIDGGQTEYVRVPLANQGLNRIPDSVTDEQALLVGDVLATGFWAARISEITEDDTVLIIGAGPTGICTLLCVMLKQPKRIIVCEKSEERRHFVQEHYPDVLLTTPDECKDFVLKNSDHGGADRVLEVAGADDTFRLAWECARPNAIVAVVALYDQPQVLPLPDMYGKNLTFKTGGVDGCDCEEVLRLIEAGKIDTTPLITHRFPLSEIEEAYRIFENNLEGVVKVAISLTFEDNTKVMKKCKIIEKLFKISNNDDFSLKYSVQRKHSSLGSGGNGDVRCATCIENGMPVALKCLHKNAQEDNEKRLRFKDEIETMLQAGKKVNGIIPILDYSISACWYVMPIADSIDNHIGDINEIINGVLQVAETLVEIHGMGLSHRDIKPANMLYYENRWVLCDFGLVDIPDNPNNLTKNTKRIGAVRTIAPEMSRYPKDADGKKADVYSLAKSLWMLLTKKSESFEGHYAVIDNSISLHNYEHLKKYYLVEIDELLDNATKNDPDERPNMEQFVSKLKEWQNVKDNIWKQQISCWNFLKKYLFIGDGPQRCVWKDPVEILKVLNIISSLPINSHLFFPNNGWAEYKKVEIASEPNCLDVYTQFGVYRIKLGKLIYESFNQQPYWNYFMLEAEPMEVLVGTECDEYEERVIEDKPNHYVSAVDSIYGVYDYDSGQKLPNGAKLIIRCLKGKYLIVLKQGPYNQIPQMDDGRHANCSNDTFREYVESLQKLYILHKMIGDSAWKKMFRNVVDSCPFKPTKSLPVTELDQVKYEVDYVKNNLSSLSFDTILGRYAGAPIGKTKYRFVFHFENSIDFPDCIINGSRMYLCKDGNIRKLLSDSEEIFEIADRESAIKIFEELEDQIKEYCKGKVPEFEIPYFSVDLIKTSNPEYVFTLDDIRSLMIQADDRVDNTLVIDEMGYANILTDRSKAQFYPVVNETWCQRKNYVGRYSILSDLDSAYHYSLGKFKDYLEIGVGQPKDDYDEYRESKEELLTIIQAMIVK